MQEFAWVVVVGVRQRMSYLYAAVDRRDMSVCYFAQVRSTCELFYTGEIYLCTTVDM